MTDIRPLLANSFFSNGNAADIGRIVQRRRINVYNRPDWRN
jgi:hypothetical protein